MKKIPTIQIDTRERTPWTFSAAYNAGKIAGTKHEVIKAGDYCLADFPDLVIIERKKSVAELYNNFIPQENMARFEREMVKLAADYKFRYIVVEQEWDALYNVQNFKYMGKTKQYAGMIVLGKLLYIMNTYKVQIIFAGKNAEHTALSILLKHYYDWLKFTGEHHKLKYKKPKNTDGQQY